MVKAKLLYQPADPHDWSDSVPRPEVQDHGVFDLPELPRLGDHIRLGGTEYPVKGVVWTPGDQYDAEVTVGF